MAARGPLGQSRGRGPHIPRKAKNAKAALFRIWSYVGKQRLALAAVVVCVLVNSASGVLATMLIGTAIDRYVVTFNPAGLFRFSFLILLVYAAAALSGWLQMRLMVVISQKAVRDIRAQLFDSLHSLPLRFFDAHTHGELMSRLANDVDNVGQALNQSLVQFVSSILTVVMTLAAMLLTSPHLTLASLVVLPVTFFVTKTVMKHTGIYFARQQKDLGELNGIIEESISGQKIVKVFGREKILMEQFREKNDQLRESGYKAQFFSAIIMPLINSVNNLGYALVALCGGLFFVWGVGGLTIGKIANMLTYSKQFSRPINEAANLFNLLQSAIAGAERVFEVLDEPPEEMDGKPLLPQNIRGDVAFRSVTFGYKPGEAVLKDVNLRAKAGDTIALVGPTGSGKTTIVNLLTRFYDVDEGEIQIDGEDIRRLARNSLRKSMGMVLQDTYLFSDTIRENLRYGRLSATDEEVEEAARLVGADRFIRQMPRGYDTVLSDGGEGISQGQRQLLSIARTILADPAILILDEATSSIDTRTEKQIQKALLHLMEGRTSFVIAHRLSTIRDANEILVIQNGQIIERGDHQSLYEQGGFYHTLYTSQFKRKTG